MVGSNTHSGTGSIRKQAGIAGQFSVTADTDDGPLTFVGSVYGGPVVMVTASGVQVFVADPGRFGTFGVEWVRRFLDRSDPSGEPWQGLTPPER